MSAQPVEDPGALAGRVAVVCGATGNLGAAICATLAQMGASVAVHGHRSRERAEAIAGALPHAERHVALAADLTDSAAARTLMAQARDALGADPTVLVDASYPSQPPRLVRELDDEYLERHLSGLRTHVNVCRAALGGMRTAGFGRIVLLSGALAFRPFPGFAVYGAVKAGVTAFARTLSLEEGAAGVTVNTLALGRIEHEGGAGAFNPDPAYEDLDEITRRRVALPQMASPADVGEAVRYLVSPAAGAVTGQTIFLAGGEPI